MTNPTCPITGRPLPDGYYLHPTLKPRMENLGRLTTLIAPAARDTAIGLAHPGRNTNTRTTRRASLLINTRIYDDVQDMLMTLECWHHLLASHLQQPTPLHYSYKPTGLLITRNADQILRWQEAPLLLDEMEHALHRCEHLASPPAGHARRFTTCPNCGTGHYTRAIRTHTTCPNCDTTFETRNRQADMWEQALYTWTRRDIALEVTRIHTGQKISRSQLQHWIRDGHIKPLGKRQLIQPNELITALYRKRPYRKRQKPPGA